MPPVKEAQQLERKAKAAKTILVSYDPSHSWLKSCDAMGVQTIQAGYVQDPQGRFKRDDENPLIVCGNTRKWYGEKACKSPDHISPLYARKESAAQDGLKALFRPEYDGKDLVVVVSHHDEDTANAIADSLIGTYDVVRNGQRINCRVVEAIPETESLGTWYLMRNQLKPGDTLLFDLGNGTTEEWIVSPDGEVSGSAKESFPVSKLAKAIGNDQLINKKLCPLNEHEPNLDLIVRALREGTIADIPLERWETIKEIHVSRWWEQMKSYLLKEHGATLQSVANVIFTGGGTALISDRLPKGVLSPADPQAASVRGMYQHYQAQVDSGVLRVGK